MKKIKALGIGMILCIFFCGFIFAQTVPYSKKQTRDLIHDSLDALRAEEIGGSGTVKSITMGLGLLSTQSPLTTSGTMKIDTSDPSILSRQRALHEYALLGHIHSTYWLKSDTGANKKLAAYYWAVQQLAGKAATSHNQAWSTITSGVPTTIGGYGITDAFIKSDTGVNGKLAAYYWAVQQLAGKAATSHNQTWSTITSGVPTTIGGYGITDAFIKSDTGVNGKLAAYYWAVQQLAGKAATSHNQAWSTITSGVPTTIGGYGITDAFIKSDTGVNGKLAAYYWAVQQLAGKAATSHNQAWSTITSGVPTTMGGYGITDAFIKSDTGVNGKLAAYFWAVQQLAGKAPAFTSTTAGYSWRYISGAWRAWPDSVGPGSVFSYTGDSVVYARGKNFIIRYKEGANSFDIINLDKTYNNYSIGSHALHSKTNETHDNIAIGDSALYNLSGMMAGNIALGKNAMNKATSNAYRNIALGEKALYTAGAARDNFAAGSCALQYNTGGDDNIAIGLSALRSNTTGNNNIAFGTEALYNNTTGIDNIAMGKYSLWKNTTAVDNTAVGDYTLTNCTEGSWNTALGLSALSAVTTGTYNTGIGAGAGASETTRSYQTYVGSHSAATNLGNDTTYTPIYFNGITGTGRWNGKFIIKDVPVGTRTPDKMLVQDTITKLIKRLPIPTIGPDIDITGNLDADSSIVAGFKANGNSGTAINIYCTQGNYQTVIRTGNCTYTLIGMKTGQVITLELIHEASTTEYTCTFSPTLKFPGGTAPLWTNTSGAIDSISIRYDGTNYIATPALDFK